MAGGWPAGTGRAGLHVPESPGAAAMNAALDRKRSYERSRFPENSSSYHHYQQRPQASQPKAPRFSGWDDDTGLIKRRSGLGRDVLRHLFRKKCEREEAERVARSQWQAWHENKCYYLKMDPKQTPMFPGVPAYFYDPTTRTWYQMPELGMSEPDVTWGYPHMATNLPPEAYKEGDEPLPRPEHIYPPGVVKVSFLYGQAMSIDPEYCQTFNRPPEPPDPVKPPPPPEPHPQDMQLSGPLSPNSSSNHFQLNLDILPEYFIDPDTGEEVSISEANRSPPPLPSPSKIPMPPSPSRIPMPPPLPESAPTVEDNNMSARLPHFQNSNSQDGPLEGEVAKGDEPPPNHHLKDMVRAAATSTVTKPVLTEASAGDTAADNGRSSTGNGDNQVVVRLPSRWRIARDPEGRAYYYNVETNECQWEPPMSTTGANDNDTADEEVHCDEADITIVEMEVEASDGEDCDAESLNDESSGNSNDVNEDSDDDMDEDDLDDLDELDVKARTGQLANSAMDMANQYSDLSAQERHLLQLRKSTKGKSKEERKYQVKLKNEQNREKREYERKRRKERHGKHRSSGLVAEKLIPKRTDKTDLMSFEEIRERLANRDAIRERQALEEQAEEDREHQQQQLQKQQLMLQKQQQLQQQQQQLQQQQAAAASNQPLSANPAEDSLSATTHSASSSSGGVTVSDGAGVAAAPADTSSESQRKIRDRFMKDVSKVIVKVLTPFRKEEGNSRGHIKTNEDFKHLAKKLTNYILTKEMKHCSRIEDLKCSDSVRKKAAGFVKKYMAKYTEGYKRSPPGPGQQQK